MQHRTKVDDPSHAIFDRDDASDALTRHIGPDIWRILNLIARNGQYLGHGFNQKADGLVAVHGEAKNFDLKNQVKEYSPIPWHPGAIKYMTEHGIKM